MMDSRAFDIKVRDLDRKSKHHIIPHSRGGETSIRNISKVNRGLHEKYHSLFENRTPEEIIDFLNKYFWKKHYKISITEK